MKQNKRQVGFGLLSCILILNKLKTNRSVKPLEIVTEEHLGSEIKFEI